MFRARTSNNAIQLLGFSLLAVASMLLASSTPLFGQEPGPSPGPSGETIREATHVLGLENVKRGAKGKLAIVDNALRFEVATGTADVSIPSIQDVFTGQDSKEMGGKPGGLAKMAMPYGSGRVLSLFASQKVDVLTLEYRDSNGGLHGVIFTLPKGQSPAVKRRLVELGAHASVWPEGPAKP
jgi:hypothetical protein